MTTKDWIYLGLIALTALAFYCNGFYAGVMRSRKVYQRLLDDAESSAEETLASNENKIAEEANYAWHRGPVRHNQPGSSRRRLPGDFQNN